MTSSPTFRIANDQGWQLAFAPTALLLALSRPPAPPAWMLTAAGWRTRDSAWCMVVSQSAGLPYAAATGTQSSGLRYVAAAGAGSLEQLCAWAEGATFRIELTAALGCERAIVPHGQPLAWALASLNGEPGYVCIPVAGPAPHRITWQP